VEGCHFKMSTAVSEFDKPYCVVDFSVYRGLNGTLIIKELAIACLPDYRRQHWVFEPPYPESVLDNAAVKENRKWSERVKYEWSEGYVPYSRLTDILNKITEPFEGRIYIHGATRCNLVASHIKRPVLNFKTLYSWVSFGMSISALYSEMFQYASPCLKHTTTTQRFCAKARCSHMADVIRKYFPSVVKGRALVTEIQPAPAAAEVVTIESDDHVVEPSEDLNVYVDMHGSSAYKRGEDVVG
jgi:hypothetical protein